MCSYFVVILIKIIILSQIKIIEGLFVSVGDYSNESIPGLNSPECGLGLVPPIVLELSLNNSCFQMKYKDRTLAFFDKPGVKHQISNRVYKGVDVRHSYESPWAVHVGPTKYSEWGYGICTGVLITHYWVLTAAHCFEDIIVKDSNGFVLNMGSNKRVGTHTSYIESKYFHSHPFYENPPGQTEDERRITRFHYDIALIRVTEGFIPNITPDNRYSINTICLPKRDEVNIETENSTFYGYGIINDNNDFPEYLQMGWVELKPFNSCYPRSMFCGTFLYENPRPCKGDSGGPLVQFVPGIENRAVLVGITQSGAPARCTNKMKYALWVPVSKHIDWILKTINEN